MKSEVTSYILLCTVLFESKGSLSQSFKAVFSTFIMTNYFEMGGFFDVMIGEEICNGLLIIIDFSKAEDDNWCLFIFVLPDFTKVSIEACNIVFLSRIVQQKEAIGPIKSGLRNLGISTEWISKHLDRVLFIYIFTWNFLDDIVLQVCAATFAEHAQIALLASKVTA